MVNLGGNAPYYGGGQVKNPSNVTQIFEPAPTFKANVGSLAVNSTEESAFIAVSESGPGNRTVWKQLGTNGGAGDFPTTPFVVGPTGQAGYQTIQDGLNAAQVKGGVVVIQPGIYTENLVIPGNCNLIGLSAANSESGVTIVGTHSLPLNGSAVFRNLSFSYSGDIFFSSIAGTTAVTFGNCYYTVGSGYFLNLPNWTGIVLLDSCDGSRSPQDGFIKNDGTGRMPLYVYNSTVGSGTGTLALFNGTLTTQSSTFQMAEFLFLSPSVNNSIDSTLFSNCSVQVQGTSTGTIAESRFTHTTEASFIMDASTNWIIESSVIDNQVAAPITGSGTGTLQLGSVTFSYGYNISGPFRVSTSTLTVVGELRAGGDIGGATGFTAITNASSTTISTGVGSVLMATANPASNAAWLKVYINGVEGWIPVWNTRAP